MADSFDLLYADIMNTGVEATPTPTPMATPISQLGTTTYVDPTTLSETDKNSLLAKLQIENAERAKNLEAQKALLGRQTSILGFGSSLADALALGYGHELAAGVEAALTSKTYPEVMAEYGRMSETLGREAPYASTAGAITGGVAPLAFMGPVRGAIGLGRQLLLGQTAAEAAPTVGQLARIGAAQGFLQGAGAAEPTEVVPASEDVATRAAAGGLGALVGGVGTPLLTKAIGGLTSYGARKLAEAGITREAARQGIIDALQSASTAGERGAILRGGASLEGYTPAEIVVAKKLTEGTPAELQAGIQRALIAEEKGIPLFLPEAVQSPAVYQSARLATIKPGGVKYAGTAIEERAAMAGNRIASVLDQIAPTRDPAANTKDFIQAANDIQDKLVGTRAKEAKRLYDQARLEAPEIISPDLDELIQKDKNLRTAIKTVKSFSANADLPDKSLDVLDQARRILTDKINAAGANEARLLAKTKTKLEGILSDAAPTWKEAQKAYETASAPLNALEESKFSLIKDFDPDRPESLGQIFNQRPEVIESLRANFVEAGQVNKWDAGVRAYLQNLAEKQPEEAIGRISKLVQTPVGKNRILAALGEKGQDVVDRLQSELTILKGQQKYFVGSPTAPMTFEERDTAKLTQALKQALSGKLGQAVGGLFAPEDTQLYRQLAETYFTPGSVATQLSKIRPLVESYQLIDALSGRLQRGVGAGTTEALVRGQQTAATALDQPIAPTQPTGGTMASMGAATLGAGELDALMAEIDAEAAKKMPVKESGEAKGGGFAGGPLAPEIVSAIENNPHGLRPSLIKAVIKQESEGKVDAKSKAGAYGLMQLMPKTAKGLGVDATNPLENVQGGMRLINTLHKRYNNMELALAAYNWGEGNMARALNTLKTKGVPATWSNIKKYGNSFPRKLPQETRKYVDAVLNKEKQFS